MASKHEQLETVAMNAIDSLNSDLSVSSSETRQSLMGLKNHIEILIEAIDESSGEGDGCEDTD